MRASDFLNKIVEANLPQAPITSQPKLKLLPLIKGLVYKWMLMEYGLNHADEPEIVNDREGYLQEFAATEKKLSEQGFHCQRVDNNYAGDIVLTHVPSKQSVKIDNYTLEGWERHLILAEKALGLMEEKDACYHKVKSRYKVWPSAYASGALVRCRKVGAKNWGNKSKK